MISYLEARNLIDAEFRKLELEPEYVDLSESLNRTLAEDVAADINLPPFDNSAVDGIAVRFDENVRKWNIAGEISAGNFEETELSPGSAVTIMTGAKIPEFCDTVFPLEDYEISNGSAELKSSAKFKKGINIRRKAGDLSADSIAVKTGTVISPKHIAVLAACGKTKVKVLRKFKFGVLSSGDELVEVSEKPEGDKIRVSNTFALCAAVEETHQKAKNLGFVRDDRELQKSKVAEALYSGFDIVITTGGVSVGKFDYLKDIFHELRVEEIFWRAYIKPGKPAFFGKFTKGDKSVLVFGLPGNPVSCMVNFDVYIRPNILELFGHPEPQRVQALLLNDIRKSDIKRHFVRGILKSNNEGIFAVTSQLSQSSGNLAGYSMANCLIEIEENDLHPTKGSIVTCIKM